jgi:hypothetical protein
VLVVDVFVGPMAVINTPGMAAPLVSLTMPLTIPI